MWLRAVLVLVSIGAPSAVRGEGAMMSDKLDPNLTMLCETATAEERGEAIGVLVAVSRPADREMLEALAARGFAVRSVIGTILTGTVKIGILETLAEYPEIVKLEGSTPMQRE